MLAQVLLLTNRLSQHRLPCRKIELYLPLEAALVLQDFSIVSDALDLVRYLSKDELYEDDAGRCPPL